MCRAFSLFFLVCIVSIVHFLFADNVTDCFIVKKTKQAVVAYEDQWCDAFGKLLQLLADFDMQKSTLQKNGIKHIMHAIESGNDIALARLPKAEQQAAVQGLHKLIDQVQKATVGCQAYSKKLETVLSKANKKR